MGYEGGAAGAGLRLPPFLAQRFGLQVVPLAEFKTNRYAHPLWHLVSKSGSPRVNGFAYGTAIEGMT